MEQNEIIEGNRLIAEFDGWKLRATPYINSDNIQFLWWEKFREGKVIRTYHHDILKATGKFEWGTYHSSWEWLMPVVEKISRIPLPGDGTRPAESHETFYPFTFGMLSPTGRPMVRICASTLFESDTLIEATWLAVVDFIKWYNTQNSPHDNSGSNDASH